MSRSVRLAIGAVAACGLIAAGGYAAATTPASHGSPVIEAAPGSAPVATRDHGSCSIRTAGSTEDQTGSDLLWVRAHPTGVVAIWVPGLNAKHCVARRTRSGAVAAQRIAQAIRHTKAFPTEPLPCPYDDNTSVRLYFTYSGGGDEYAAVALAGCRPISAPGRASRWSDDAVERALHRIAPAAWRGSLTT